MKASDSIKNIAAALLAAQAEMTHPKRTSQNPHLRNKFADLPNVIDTVKPTLNAHGVVVVQSIGGYTGGTDGNQQMCGVVTRLIHADSGEWIEAGVTQVVDAQKGMNLSQCIGSAITYLRRYSLSAMACVASEPDDDGNEISGGSDKPRKPANPADDLDL